MTHSRLAAATRRKGQTGISTHSSSSLCLVQPWLWNTKRHAVFSGFSLSFFFLTSCKRHIFIQNEYESAFYGPVVHREAFQPR